MTQTTDREIDTLQLEAESLYDLICANFYCGTLTPKQAKDYGIQAIKKDYLRLLTKQGTAPVYRNVLEALIHDVKMIIRETLDAPTLIDLKANNKNLTHAMQQIEGLLQ